MGHHIAGQAGGNPDVGRAVDLYRGELLRGGKSPETMRAYDQLLQPLAVWLERRGVRNVGAVTTDDCREFLDTWRPTPLARLSKSTRRRDVSVIAGFFRWLYEEDKIDRDPAARLRRPSRQRPEDLDVVTISSADVERLFEHVEIGPPNAGPAQEWRELLCLSVALYLGPRRRAIAALRRRHVDLEGGTIRFREKGDKTITKPMPAELREILRAADDNHVWASGDDYLVPNRRPGAVRRKERSDKVIYETVKTVAGRAGVTCHVHALRAAFAVHYLECHPGDLEALQPLMGHARLETTAVYLRRLDRTRAMERVRDLSWNGVFPPRAQEAHTGFEPVLPTYALPEPVRLKLAALRARGRAGVRDR